MNIERRIRAREREAERRAREFERRIKARERVAESRRRAYEAELRKANGGEEMATALEKRSTDAGDEGARTFGVETTRAHEELVEKARKAAEEHGAMFRGDTSSGSFFGNEIKGRYEVEGSTARVTVTDKPRSVSWSTVKSRIEEFFG